MFPSEFNREALRLGDEGSKGTLPQIQFEDAEYIRNGHEYI